MIVDAIKSIQEHLRYRYLVKILSPYLEGYRDVLDLGSSSGKLAERLLHNIPGLRFIGVDVHVLSAPRIPMVEGNGRRLPFGNDTFDCVMMVDVLHHDEHPKELLAEAKRVARHCVLIKDHYWENRLDLALLRYSDYIGNRLYGVKLPYTFLDLQSWHSLIRSYRLKISGSSKFKFNALDPCKHVIFELHK